MKQYLLISNTTGYKINNDILDYISTKFKDIVFQKKNFRELSPKKAYELELQNIDINIELQNFTVNLLSKNNIDCNFIKATKDRKKRLLLADMDSLSLIHI